MLLCVSGTDSCGGGICATTIPCHLRHCWHKVHEAVMPVPAYVARIVFVAVASLQALCHRVLNTCRYGGQRRLGFDSQFRVGLIFRLGGSICGRLSEVQRLQRVQDFGARPTTQMHPWTPLRINVGVCVDAGFNSAQCDTPTGFFAELQSFVVKTPYRTELCKSEHAARFRLRRIHPTSRMRRGRSLVAHARACHGCCSHHLTHRLSISA